MVVEKSKAQVITELLRELFKSHNFDSEVYEDWIIPKGTDYAIKGYWYAEATENSGQLSIEVFINSEMIMVESFSGQGETNKERLQSAFSSFIYHTFPTLLWGIWGKSSTKVEQKIWNINNEKYKVYVGSQGVINYDKKTTLIIPPKYTTAIESFISEETMDKPFHWFTFFYANLNGLDNYAEVLKDNIKLISTADKLKQLDWKRSNHYYAVRQFVMLEKIS